MNARDVVERLEADFQRIEAPLDVTFDSPEDARALVLWICCPFLRRDPVWTARLAPAVIAISESLNAATCASIKGEGRG